MRKSTSPFFIGLLPSAGTSSTWPRTCGTMFTTYLMTRTSCDEGATTFSVRMSMVRPTIGSVITITCDTVFHGSHLNLKKTSQTKKP